ncbi:hypothetical protein F5888DRAFT_1121021 [Russula emetica]|nr:hypothetical protein F5888DRAFT_1121021 [Russula emetica]
MRRYDIVSGILLILSIINFALAAPVLVQEKRQASVDVVRIPRGVTTVLGDYFKSWGKPVESSEAHASSSSAPPTPDHGSTNVVQAPGPNPASSTANPGSLMEPSSPSLTTPEDEGHDAPLDSPPSPEPGSNHGLTEAHTLQPNPNPTPSTDEEFDWDYWTNLKDSPPQTPASLGQAHGDQVAHILQPNPGPSADRMNLEGPPPSTPPSSKPSKPKSSTNSGFNWKILKNLKNSLPTKSASSKLSNLKLGSKLVNVIDLLGKLDPLPRPSPASWKPSNPKPPTKSGSKWENLLDMLGKLDPLHPQPDPKTPSPKYSIPSPSDPGPSNPGLWDSGSRLTTTLDSHPNLMKSLQPPPPLRIGPPKEEEPEEPENEVVPGVPTTPKLTDPELNSDRQSLSAVPRPVDLQAAIYAAKGKATAIYTGKDKAKQSLDVGE